MAGRVPQMIAFDGPGSYPFTFIVVFDFAFEFFCPKIYHAQSAEDITSSKATSISNVKCVLLNTTATSTSSTITEFKLES